jgi:ribosomal protein S18
MALLKKFLTIGGKIVNSRYTGVRRTTQKKITREIKKARHLGNILIINTGLISFTCK